MRIKKNVSTGENSVKVFFKNKIKLEYLVVLLLVLLDIGLTICFAKKNIINYATILENEVFVSKTRNLLVGRNYIVLIVTVFFAIYMVAFQKYFFKRKISVKYVIFILLAFLFLNVLLFYFFTKRVY